MAADLDRKFLYGEGTFPGDLPDSTSKLSQRAVALDEHRMELGAELKWRFPGFYGETKDLDMSPAPTKQPQYSLDMARTLVRQ
ncbi:hypothetical protein VM1G_11288 [Cytospora mali]|uniref:Uncharacterized protein n=1 Tax=Cytospora mali TaxID=578113 RepID=A0A194VN85_CYTMA|nr:hypothetical protein VM1G_11288 [Valsa mali]